MRARCLSWHRTELRRSHELSLGPPAHASCHRRLELSTVDSDLALSALPLLSPRAPALCSGLALKAGSDIAFPAVTTPLPGYYRTGDSTTAGIGVPAVASSGAQCANALLNVFEQIDLNAKIRMPTVVRAMDGA